MKKFITLFTISLFFFLTSDLGAKRPDLTPDLAYKKAEEIFKAHVTYKKMNTEVMKRTFINFIDELDPTKTYFLEDELITWTKASTGTLQETVYEYKARNFRTFEKIYQTAIKAIERRNDIENEIQDAKLPSNVDYKEFKDISFAKTPEELKNRLIRLKGLQVETAAKIDEKTTKTLLKRIQKRRAKKEEEIIGESSADQREQLLVFFLKAFSSALDTHTAYFTPAEANQFMILVQQRLFGIGAQLRDDLNGFTLTRLLDGGPAIRSKELKVGDKIISVNGEPVVGMEIQEAVELIRGPQGTKVVLTILRTEESENEEATNELANETTTPKTTTFDIKITRDEIVLKETRFEHETVPFGDGVIAHLHLYSFYQDPKFSSAGDIKAALDKIQNEHKLKGVILDLRTNAGGLLPQAVAVSGLFIKKGIVVSIKDHNGYVQHLRNFNGDTAWDGPLIILINRASASASEIVSQTLKDYGRAIIVGDDRTFGKGSYQTFTLSNLHGGKINPQGEYKVTRGLYYTVSGRSPQLSGSIADIEVPGMYSQLEIGEAFEKFPLQNDEIPPNYHDGLADIHPFHRGKVLKMYSDNLQEKLNIFSEYMEVLRENSKTRIAENENYKSFLKEITKENFDANNIEKYGQNDLQLEESVNIMKDLIHYCPRHIKLTSKKGP